MIRRFVTFLVFLFLFSFSVFPQKFVLDTEFSPTLNSGVGFLEILNDGKILIVGGFTSINGVGRKAIARLNADGSLDESFNANWLDGGSSFGGPSITAMKVLPDGKILVAGNLPFDGNCCNPRIRRLNYDGSPDPTMTATPFNSGLDPLYNIIRSVNQHPNGKIFMCGKFTLPNGNSRLHLARYNNDGTYDSTFATVIDNECQDVEVLPDGKYYLSSWSGTINGTPHERLLRFNADDSIDTTFNAEPLPGSNPTYYYKIKLESNGKLIVFRNTGCCVEQVARLNADGSLHTNYPTSIDEPGDVAVQSNGKVVVAALFDNVFGQSDVFNRFNLDTTHDPSQPRMGLSGPSSSAYPKAIEFTADGKLLMGGNFTQVNDGTNGSVSRTYLARFQLQTIPIKPRYDFDGDGKDDIAVFRPSDRVWYINQSTAGFTSTQFGLSTDIPIASDYDGDGKADIAVFRDGTWYWLRSSDSVFSYKVTGQAGDTPTPAFNNLSGTTNFLVFRSTSTPPNFYSQGAFQPNASVVQFRNMTLQANDKPVIADYDGD